MTDSVETRHAIAFHAGAEPTTPGATLGISSVDELALDSFINCDAGTRDVLLKNVNALAHALWRADDRDDARIRTLARLIAITKTKALMLESKRDELLITRDFKAALVLEKLLDGTVRRLAVLLAEHRHACAVGHRSVNVTAVAVNQAGVVNVSAGR